MVKFENLSRDEIIRLLGEKVYRIEEIRHLERKLSDEREDLIMVMNSLKKQINNKDE